MDNNWETITDILCDILDVDANAVQLETYVIRDLGAESIDLLELAVTFADRFKIEIADEDLFLKSLRRHVEDAEENGAELTAYLEETYPFLSRSRIGEILADLDGGPVLKVKDLLNYVQQQPA